MDRLGPFEHLLLLALVRLGDDIYGVPIRDDIERRTGRLVSPGAIHTRSTASSGEDLCDRGLASRRESAAPLASSYRDRGMRMSQL
jgi:hypothetical protein